MGTSAQEKGIILVVDAVPNSLNGTRTALENEGYLVTVTTKGEDALQQVGLEMLDLILIDVALPGTDGYEICRRFRLKDETRDIPIIMMSNAADALDAKKVFSIGAVDYIVKPFKTDDLVARAKVYIGAKHLGKGLLESKKFLEKRLTESEETLSKVRGEVEKEVGERKKVEAELLSSITELQSVNANLSALEDASDAAILLTDSGGKMASCNQAFIDLWKIPQETISSNSDEGVMKAILSRLAAPDDFLARVKFLNENPDEKPIDELRLSNGMIFEQISASVIGNENAFLGRIWCFRDITKRRLDEERLKMANVELELLRNKVVELDDTIRRIQQESTDEKKQKDTLQKSFDALKKTVHEQAAHLDESVSLLKKQLS